MLFHDFQFLVDCLSGRDSSTSLLLTRLVWPSPLLFSVNSSLLGLGTFHMELLVKSRRMS